MSEACVFCKIIKGETPSYKIYESENFLSFLDIRPLTKGNALVVPKRHCKWVYEVPNFGEYFEVARNVGLATQKAFGAKWICFLTLGLEVPHAHIRVVPRYKKDLHGVVVDINVYEKFDKKKMAEIAKEIKKYIQYT